MSAVSKPPDRREQATFFWRGRKPRSDAEPQSADAFVPAALAPYRDIDAIRHDYPLVLFADSRELGLDSLGRVVGKAVAAVQDSKEADGLGRQALPWHAARIEKAVRRLSSHDGPVSLRQAWMGAAEGLASNGDQSFLKVARALGEALPDGELVACDRDAASRVTRHLWQAAQHRRSAALQTRLERLLVGLKGILSADIARSKPGRTAERLKASVGPLHADQFDFDAMSRVLASRSPESMLSPKRRRRIEGTLAALESQGFVSLDGGELSLMSFEFDSCVAALGAFRERLPKAVGLARAIAVAELEVDGAYREGVHDPILAEFGSAGLDPRDFGFLPTTFVCLDFAAMSEAEQNALALVFAAELPFKVLVRIDDLVEPSPAGEGRFSLGSRARRLAWSALSDGGVFALQTTGAGLLGARGRIERAFEFDGPSLLSVYSGASPSTRLPAYLAAAAASESRVFPSFSYDPSAGSDWASRFSIEGNAQPESAWPVRTLQFEDADLQLMTESEPFTAVEFAMADSRLESHFSAAPRESWDDSHVPVREALEKSIDPLSSQVPFSLAVDAGNRLHRVLVDVSLIGEARRCAQAWRSMQELGGIANSHALSLLETERADFEDHLRRESETQPPAIAPAVQTEAPEPPGPELSPEPETTRSDEPYIETPRCTTCNECTNLNPKMFAYNENKQAYIKDPGAGTYAQLVEAAETCQVSIIHPGKPRNPSEPGLEELLKRAEPFQ